MMDREAGDHIIKAEDIGPAPTDAEKAEFPVQTLILSKERFPTLESARSWLKDHNFPAPKVDEKEGSWRFRQFDPQLCSVGSFRSWKITEGVTATGCRKSKQAADIDPSEGVVLAMSKTKTIRRELDSAFWRKGEILYRLDSKPDVKEKQNGTLVLVERQRAPGSVIIGGPHGAVDASVVVELAEEGMGREQDPQKVADENLGLRVFVLESHGQQIGPGYVLLTLMEPETEKSDKT